MKLITWNVNGIRSVAQKGFLNWMQKQEADVICLQEIKATSDQLDLFLLNPAGYQSHWHSAEKPGYSGVAIYSKKEPLNVQMGLGVPEIDREGRVLVAEYKNFTLINAYFPNSQRDHARLDYKLAFCSKMHDFLNKQVKKGKNVVLCGDFNIAHRAIDLKNPKSNENNAGFLPQERAWMEQLLNKGFVDSFRHFNQDPGHYTWWSYRPGVRERNIGWRLDYHVVNKDFLDRVKSASHQNQVMGSDHCPVVLELKN